MWVTTKEAAKLLGKSARTVQRNAKKGKLKCREVPGIGRGGVSLEIWVEKITKNNEKTNDKMKRETTFSKNKPTNDTKSDVSTNDNVKCTSQSTSQSKKCDVSKVKNNNNKQLEKRHTPKTTSQKETTLCNSNQNKHLANKRVKTNDRETTNNYIVKWTNDNFKDFVTIPTVQKLTRWHRNTIDNKIKNNELRSIKQKKQGGGFRTLVDVKTLPPAAEDKFRQQNKTPDPGMGGLTESQRSYAFAMERAILTWQRYRSQAKRQGLRKQDGDKQFESDVAAGKILTSEADTLCGISVKTLYRNKKKWEKAGRRTSVLAPDRKGRRGRKPIKSDAFYAMATTWIIRQPKVKASHLYQQLVDAIKAEKPKMTLPSYSTFIKFYNEVKERQSLIIAKKQGKKELDNLLPYVPRENDALPGDVWQYDGYIMKMLVHNPWLKDNLIKPVVVYFFDVSTGLITGYSISYSERSDVIAAAWYDAMRKYPAPKILQPDNPTGIYNEQLLAEYIVQNEQRKKYIKLKQRALEFTMNGRRGIFFDCGVKKIKFVKPGNSKGKKIEPAHFHIFRKFETQPRFADVYVGTSPDDRPEHLQRTNKAILNDSKLEIPEWDWLVGEIDKYIQTYNNRKKKSLQGYSPREAYLQLVDTSQKLSNEELRCKALWEKIVKPRNGYVKLFGNVMYQHPAFTVLKEVRVRYNVNDLTKIEVMDKSGRIMSTPAILVKKGSYIDDKTSVEAIRAAKTYQKKSLEYQKEILLSDMGRLNEKQLIKLLDSDIGQEQKEKIQERINELEKYPEFGKMKQKPEIRQQKSEASRQKLEEQQTINDEDIQAIIDADFEVEKPEEDDSWLDEIINSEKPTNQRETKDRSNKKIEEMLERLGVGGK